MQQKDFPYLIRFAPGYFERIWGGQALGELFGMPLPAGAAIGEAWLVSDHPAHSSVVSDGPWDGHTLRELMECEPERLLGHGAKPTAQGRFPLLLKLLDAQDTLSIQVHPDDATAARLGEPDGGKTEMWHILHAAPGSEIITGLDPACTPDAFATAAEAGKLAHHLVSMAVEPCDSVFIPAGTVHAIGKGIALAEIQQNSDITYRISDYNRTGPDGKPRVLHLDKAREAIHFGAPPARKAHPKPLALEAADGCRLATCPFFAADRIHLRGNACLRLNQRRTFHILLAIDGAPQVAAHGESAALRPGDAVLLSGYAEAYEVSGVGTVVDYFVPGPEDGASV